MTSRQTEPELYMYELMPWRVPVREYNVQLVDVGVEYPVDEADTRTLVRILIW